jgi:type II secretory pathway component GspD/PulD (secretin)
VRRACATLFVALAMGTIAAQPARADRGERAQDRQQDRQDDRQERPAPGMRARVFNVKHQNAGDLVNALRPLSSGATGAMFQPSDQFNTVTVRDFPENLAAVEQALKRLDVPTPPQPDVEMKIRVLLGSPLPGPGQYPSELESVVKQLSGTLQYKSYHLVATVSQRVRAGSGANGKGQVLLAQPATDESTNGQLHYSVDKVSLPQAGTAATHLIAVKKLKVSLESGTLGEAEVSTGLTLREDEKVVMVTSNLKNRAMIVVVSARLLRRP